MSVSDGYEFTTLNKPCSIRCNYLYSELQCVFFFFQAEDGIRDLYVTGVQTCALPIYQDSCHLAHGQKIRSAPRKLLAQVPGLEFREMALSDLCCGSAGIYNVVHNQMAMQILEKKMTHVNQTEAEVIATANPGCLLQLQAGVRLHGRGQRVVHVVEILDEAYRKGCSPETPRD